MKILLLRRKAVLVVLLLTVGIFFVSLTARADGASTWSGAEVVPAEAGTYYTVEEVYYENPYIIRGEDSSIAGKRIVAVKVTIHGEGFMQKATGPQIWLNGFFTMRAKVSGDGKSVEAYFTEPLNAVEKAAEAGGAWELIYKSHDGAKTVHRLSPTGNPVDVNRPPTIVRLSPEELTRVNELKQKFGIE